MHLQIRAFRAVNELETCLRFRNAHRKVLVDYGITNVTSNTEEWMRNENVYCVVAEQLPAHGIIGGVRVQVYDGVHKLPLQRAVARMDPKINDVVEDFRVKGGVGELCALWNSREVAGLGISIILVRAAIAIAGSFNINTLMCICADYTLKMFEKVGFKINDSLGPEGGYPYPNATYTARILGILNPGMLNSAEVYDRERISSLRANPTQEFVEEGSDGDIKIGYNLVFEK